MRKNPLVSVIIPTYNRQDTILRAIKSVINQTYKNWELIVIDDGSIDDTKKIIQPYLKNKKIKYFYQNNKGVSVARNYGIRKSKGAYIAFLDSDDEFLKEKLEIQLVEMIKNNASLSLVGEYQVLENNKLIKKQVPKLINLSKDYFINNLVSHSASFLMIKNNINLFFDKKLPAAEDTDFILRSLNGQKVIIIPKILINRYKTLNGNRLSSNLDKKILSYQILTNKIKKGIYNLPKDYQIKLLQKYSLDIGFFYILQGEYRKGRAILINELKNADELFQNKKYFIIYLLSYLPPIFNLIIFFTKKLWSLGLIKA